MTPFKREIPLLIFSHYSKSKRTYEYQTLETLEIALEKRSLN